MPGKVGLTFPPLVNLTMTNMTTQKLMTRFNDEYHTADLGNSFSACCGSKYRDKRFYGGPGIELAIGIVGKEKETPEKTVKHIETKNGIISICITKMWPK